MINKEEIQEKRKTARFAGLLYFLLAVTAAFGLVYVPSKIIVSGNANQTATNIKAFGSFFRLGMMSNLVSQVLFIFLVMVLYRLFKEVNKKQAQLMVALVVTSVAISFAIVILQIGALIVLSGASYLNVFEQDKLNAISMIFLQLSNHGVFIVSFFWGLWLFPFGYLAYKSGFIPKIFGVLLVINCFAYLIDSSVFLLAPNYHDLVSKFTMPPLSIGELSIVLWLLIKGIKSPKLS